MAIQKKAEPFDFQSLTGREMRWLKDYLGTNNIATYADGDVDGVDMVFAVAAVVLHRDSGKELSLPDALEQALDMSLPDASALSGMAAEDEEEESESDPKGDSSAS